MVGAGQITCPHGCASDEYVSYLMTVDELMFTDEIDCRDLFDGKDPRERIMVFEICFPL